MTLIIHNAWKLDFNLSLSSFESNIRATRNLIDFALAGPYSSTIRFLFTSSVASAQSWNQEKGLYPEEVVTDAGVAVGGGYGEGKYVAERVCLYSCASRDVIPNRHDEAPRQERVASVFPQDRSD